MAAIGPLREAGILRVIYKQLSPGDLRKLRAKSNDAQTGGGARDFRLPYRAFDPVMRKLLPQTRQEERRRNGARTTVDFHWGPVKFGTRGKEIEVVNLDWESPTDARPTEGRISRIHTHFNLPKEDPEFGAVLFLIMQHETEVRAHYAYERDLRDGKWNSELTQHILACMDNPNRRARSLAQGFIDCVEGLKYCHGIAGD
ncbi:hypothetical protein [Streptomyces alboflavus]|uniref:hypothetical protein n=1 Tax=Streptomyces alboflavus TaxID=67267 RepID=UPI0012FE9C80|nr:hypothetical protein [Streptomyces alboflavus]